MKYLFELSKENKTIPKSEITSCLLAEDIKYTILESNNDVLIIGIDCNEDKIKQLALRLSFTFFIDKLLFFCPINLEEIKKNALEKKIENTGSVAIRCKNRSEKINSQKIVKILAEIYTKNHMVSLEKPDIEIRALVTDSTVYVGIKNYEINRSCFEERKVQNRPFFSPISLHPKIARALVNLSAVKKNQILLDPFCGTGGILLEAGLIGVKVIGSDIENKMIQGSKKTLDFFNIKNYDLFCCDVGDVKKYVKKVNAVVTDLPYGKSTTTKGETTDKLYARAFENISKILKKNSRAVIGVSNIDVLKFSKKYLSLCEIYEFRVHRSLTRYFCVFQK